MFANITFICNNEMTYLRFVIKPTVVTLLLVYIDSTDAIRVANTRQYYSNTFQNLSGRSQTYPGALQNFLKYYVTEEYIIWWSAYCGYE